MPRHLTSSLVAAPLLAVAAAAASLAPQPAAAKVYGGADRDVPLARFQDPLCPGIVGVAEDSALNMVGLIRKDAAGFGLTLADPETCEPNMIVMVIDDPKGYLDRLRKQKPYLFDFLGKAELARLFDGPGPAYTWTRAFVRTRDGLPVRPSQSLTELPQTTMEAAHSLIYVATRRDIVTSMVLIDRKAVQGLTVGQIAAYATLRGLSDDEADKLEAPGPTIRSLFDAGAGDKPAGLTDADRIFLQTLYSTMPNVPASITLAMADQRIAEAARGKE